VATDGRQTRWRAHNEERRRLVVDAAIEVIEAAEPGAELHVQQVAQRAGLSRSVVYRLFSDRAELDRAIQARILDEVLGRLTPALDLQGSLHEIVERTIRAYVEWALAHPALHRMADHDTASDGHGPLEERLSSIAERIRELLMTSLAIMGGDLDDRDQKAAEVLIFGLVSGVFGAVRRWVLDPGPVSAGALSQLLTRTLVSAFMVHADALGIAIDPDEPVEQALARALAEAEAGA